MTEKEIELKRIVESNIQQSKENNLDKESNKFDFKAKWYNLKELKSINEFLKDVTSIVNTIGPTGYIVIGYDEKAKKINNAKFKDSGLKDSSEILGMISKRIDRAFDIDIHDIIVEGKSISIIEIPPSLDKPHIIRHYTSRKDKEDKHVVFVKSASGTVVANKNHLDRMYYDRKNIRPDYQVYVTSTLRGFHNQISRLNSLLVINQYIYIENTGLRPICIKGFKLDFYFEGLIQHFNCKGEYLNNGMTSNMNGNHLIVQSGTVKQFYLTFEGSPISEIINSTKSNNYIESDRIKGTIKLNTEKVIQFDMEIPVRD